MPRPRNQRMFALLTLTVLSSALRFLDFSEAISTRGAEITSSMMQGQVNYYGKQIEVFRLFGQKYITEAARNKVTANSNYHASGIIVDRNSTPNIVYTVSTGNNRVLGYKLDCPPNTTCPLDGTKPPDIIIGQPNAEAASCNGDSNLGFTKNPTATSLCLLGYPLANNTAEAWMRVNIDVDSQGNLYVPDIYNNRILKYNQPLSTDTTNGKGDAVADYAWGQNDLNSNGRNRGPNYGAVSPPDNHSLWISFGPPDHVTSRGASVDSAGNVWVADTFNNRVLRFPANSPNASLVIGQSDFTRSGCTNNGPLNRLCTPTMARVHPTTGDLYVLDEYPAPFFARLLVFHPPFTNGMTAYKVIRPLQNGPFTNWGGWDGLGTYQFQSTGFVFNTFRQGEYAAGEIWLNEHQTTRALLVDFNGNIIKAIGARDNNSVGGDVAYNGAYSACGDPYTGNKLWWPGGSIGLDNANNIYFADEFFHTFYRYALPYTLIPQGNITCLPEANGKLALKGPNVRSDDRLGESVGLSVYGNQLLVRDEDMRLKVYNNYESKEFGVNPDFVLRGGMQGRNLISDSIDDQGRLWIAGEHGQIRIFQLPFTSNTQQPIADFVKLYWADNGQVITDTNVWCMAFDKINHKMYLADIRGTRIFRVSNYNEFNNHLYVDMVIGQRDKDNVACNQGLPAPNAETLCSASQIKFDRLGNLFVVDNKYECHRNDRIVMYNAASLQNASGLFPNLSASKVFIAPSFTSNTPCGYGAVDLPGSPVSLAFNSRNEMVVGNDGYYGDLAVRQLKQLWFYRNPLVKTTPDGSIDLYMGTPGELAFDANDNLLIQDHTWYRVTMINLDRDPEWLVYLPDALTVSSLSPATTTFGSPHLTLTVTGNNFVPGTSALWNGSPLATTFLSTTQIQAIIPAVDLATPSTATIVAMKPNGEKSNSLPFVITGGCGYTPNPTSQSLVAAGSTGSTSVTTGAGCMWTAVSNDAWITITSGASGNGNGAVNYSVAANPGPQRTGTMTIAGQSFTVMQDGGCPAITVNPANPMLPNGRAGVAYNQTFTQTGVTTPTFSLSAGTLPTGLTLTGAVLSGTPTVSGTFNFTLRATDSNSCFGERAYTLLLNPPCATITVNPATLPNGFQGTTYPSQTLTTTGGTAPYTFAVTTGNLPGGLTLSSGGALTGTPTAAGTFSFSVTATDNTGCTGTRAYTVIISGNGLQFYPLAAPVRLLDTRNGASPNACSQPNMPIAGQSSRTQSGRNLCTIPANAVALTGNITTVQSGGGFLTLYPSDAQQPTVASTNYGVNEIINNVFTVGLGADGAFKIFANNTTDVVVDVTGFYAPPAANGLFFHPLPAPVRLLETRVGQPIGCVLPGAPLAGNAESTQQAISACTGIPAAARAIVGNATTVGPHGGGFLTIFPADTTRPLVASSNFNSGQVVNGPFAVGLAANGQFKIFTTATTDLVIDVLGYYSPEVNDANGAGLLLTPLAHPVRLLETRPGLPVGCFKPGLPLAGGAETAQPARGLCDGLTIPANALGVVGNATVVFPVGQGFLTLWPSTATRPTVATSNYNSGDVGNRHFIVGLGSGDGAFKLFSQVTTDLVLDLSGYFAP